MRLAQLLQKLLDTAINCGINFTKPLLQRALNLLNKQGKEGWSNLVVDGQYGPLTLQALATYLNRRNKEGEKYCAHFKYYARAALY